MTEEDMCRARAKLWRIERQLREDRQKMHWSWDDRKWIIALERTAETVARLKEDLEFEYRAGKEDWL